MLFRTRLLISFLALTVIPTAVIGTLSFYRARQSLRENEIASLGTIADLKVDKINSFFQERVGDIEVARRRAMIIRDFAALQSSSPGGGDAYQTAKTELNKYLGYVRDVYGYHDVMLADESGKVIFLCNRTRTDFHEGLPLSALEPTSFEKCQDQTHFSDIYHSREPGEDFRMVLCAPVRDDSGAFLGEIVFELDMDSIYKLIQDPTGLGQTGETYIGKNAEDGKIIFLNPLRHDPHAALTRMVALGGSTAVPVQEAASGKSGEGLSVDYRGKRVIGAWRPVPATHWGLVAKMDADEAFAPITDLARQTVLFGLAILLLAVLLARLLAGSLSRPIRALSKGAAAIGNGDLDHKVGTAARDEIGELSREFDRMTGNLKTVTASRDDLNREMEERRRAEESLRASEDRYRDLVENSQDMICTHDLQGNLRSINEAAARSLGYSSDEMLKMNLRDLLDPKYRGLFDIYLAAMDQNGESQGIMRILSAKGEPRLWEYHNTLRRRENEEPIVRGMAHDVTDRVRAEATVKRMNRALRTISECNQILVRSSSEQELLDNICATLVGHGGYRMVWVGFAQDDEAKSVRPAAWAGHVAGFFDAVQISWADSERGSCPTGKTIRSGRPHFVSDIMKDSECAIMSGVTQPRGYAALIALPLAADGKTLGALNLFSGRTLSFDEEEIKLLTELADDVSYGLVSLRTRADRERAEAELHASLERYHQTLDNMMEGCQILDPDLRYLYINDAAARHGRKSREELLGRAMAESYPGIKNTEMYKTLQRCLADQVPRQMENEFTYPDGRRGWFELNIQPVPEGVFILSIEITERKNLHAQLLQSQKMEAVGRLAGGIAHDFNNVLTIILGLSEFLLKGFAEGDQRRTDVAEISKAAERAAGLTRQLLAFSRKQVIAPVALDLSQAVAGMDKMLRRVLGEDIAFATRLAPALDLCKADPGQIEQVILNLAVNARDAMPTGGKLTLETSNVNLDESYTVGHLEVQPGPYVMMAVSDTGSGMDQETMDHIFEPFFTTKELGKGTGLGLSTVYGIVKQNGGHILVYSEPGKGTSFKIYLPRIEEAGKAELKPAPVVESLQGSETVLLVEDDPQLKRLITRYLSRHGYNVITAGSGQEALKIGASHPDPVHLLITDVVMPGMNGRELADKLTDSRPGLKVLFMSGYTDNHIVHHGVLDPGTNFIQKPFTATTLARKVREVLDA